MYAHCVLYDIQACLTIEVVVFKDALCISESLRAICETFVAARKLVDHSLKIIETKIDRSVQIVF